MDNDIYPPSAHRPQPGAPYQPPASPQKPSAQPRKKQPSVWRDALSTIGVLIIAILVAIGLITFVFQSYQVDGPSMENTLQNNDRLIVWKLPRTWARITGNPYVPKRGDIVVFTETGLASYGQQNTKQLIKRVIGLPGDHVVVKDGDITVYNAAHPNGFDPDTTLPYSKAITTTTSGNVDITLGAKEIFVCGDNRPDSLDSRSFGPVPLNDVVGKLVLRILPLNHIKVF